MGGIYDQIPGGLSEVDVIIVGGGTAGCIVAGRLSDTDQGLSILVVERGHDNANDPTVTNPLFFMENIGYPPESNPRMMAYQGKNEANLVDRALTIPTGSILGGGSSINMLTYTRPQREDLDGWNMPGWSADNMLPYMKKFETYHGPGSSTVHGLDGPIHISKSSFGPTRLQEQLIEAAAKLGIAESVDLQDLDSNHAVQRNLRYISPGGNRQDTAHAYIHPRLQDGKHPNLRVLVEHEVLRVLFENKRAAGVEVRGTPDLERDSSVHTIKARKMVIVSAGALGSPLLLERSGVGDKEVLDRAGIDPVSELLGVGEGFQDHNSLLASYHTSLEPGETVDHLLNGKSTFKQLLEEKDEILAWNTAEVTAKIRPTSKEIDALLSPGARALWDRDFKDVPNKPVASIASASCFPGPIPESEKDERFLTLSSFLVYPYARGHIHAQGPTPEHGIDLETGILTDREDFDLSMAMWVYKKQREIARRLDVYRGESALLCPPFAANSEAACKKRDGPLPPNVRDIVYTEADDEVLRGWIRATLSHCWHEIGTCKMAPREDGGVVNERLGVYGVEALKVADLSVVPVNLAANTGSMALTIGEKAADIFAKELGYSK